MKIQLAFFFFGLGVLFLSVLAYLNSAHQHATPVFSQYSLLNSTWEKYKAEFITADGRIIDYSQNDMTTSEGQSYALLRSVWIDDKETFDRVWKWTKDNLKRPDDHLFAWNWGKREDGSYGIIGGDSATDADSDIALALLFASKKWDDRSYYESALPLLKDLWECCTTTVAGKRYFLPGNWAESETEIVLNPSYFMPYAWRIFHTVDSEHDWLSLVDPAYEVLHTSGQLRIGDKDGVGLPPDWISLQKNTGELRAPTQEKLRTTYAFDAMRVPWRIALDYEWNKDDKASRYLQSLEKLSQIYTERGMLTGVYEHDGNPLTDYESPAMYATALNYFAQQKPEQAEELYKNKILSLYSNDTNTFKSDLNYYDQNWLWFSIGLYHHQLPNLYAEEEES